MDKIRVQPIRAEFKHNVWAIFSAHHYLTESLNVAAKCWALVSEDGDMIGFTSVLSMPGAYKNAWREHRTVVLPDYQGMGIGALVGDMLGEMHAQEGKLLFSRTSHPRLARYRLASPRWIETATSQKPSNAGGQRFKNDGRVAFSFQYVPCHEQKPHAARKVPGSDGA